MKVQVCIIGGGPSGLLLSQLLHLKGIDTLVLEKYSREHVLARIRAGVIEHGMAKLMREAQCGERMDRDGEIHNGFHIAHDGVLSHIDLNKYSGGNSVVVYGQTELTRDLYEARDRAGGKVVHEAADTAGEARLHGQDGAALPPMHGGVAEDGSNVGSAEDVLEMALDARRLLLHLAREPGVEGRGVDAEAATPVERSVQARVQVRQVRSPVQDREEHLGRVAMLTPPGEDPAAGLDQGTQARQLLLVEAAQAPREGRLEIRQARERRLGPA